MPRVTVVVPTYRRGAYLEGALASLRAQTLTDLEVLVCDNADDPAVAGTVAALGDRRFVYTGRPHDLGLARNALLGFAAARSPLLTKLDDDDVFEPDTLALLVEALERHPCVDVAFGRLRFVDAGGRDLPVRTAEMDTMSGRAALPPGLVPRLDPVVTSGAASLACAVFRREVLEAPVPDAVASAYDLHLLLRLAGRGAPGWYCPNARTRYRLHPGNDSTTGAVAQGMGALHAYDIALAQARRDRRRSPEILAAARTRTALATARALLRAGENDRARRVLLDDLRQHPTPAALRLALGSLAPAALTARVSRSRGAAWEAARARRGVESLTTTPLPDRVPTSEPAGACPPPPP